jgi:uncharacterized protein YbjT (DUF2867 family)
MARIAIAGSSYPKAIGTYLARAAHEHGHQVVRLGKLGDEVGLDRDLVGADAVVLIPLRGDIWRHTHRATVRLIEAAHRQPAPAHLVLFSSFAVGHGAAHPLNGIDPALLPGRLAAERDLRASGLPYTIVRATWLTDDPPGSHAVTLTQNPCADGMVARADIAAAMLAAIEHPSALGTTFALFNEPGPTCVDWAKALSGLRLDVEDEDLVREDPA